MTSATNRERVENKRRAVAAKIREIAPHADMILGILDETKIDMLLLGLNVGHVEIDPEGGR